VPVVFGLGAVEDFVALSSEDAFNAGAKRRQRVRAPDCGPPSGERDVHRPGRCARGFERRTLLVERRLDLALQIVGVAPEDRTLVGGRASDFLEKRCDRAAFTTEIAVPQDLHFGVRVGRCELTGKLRSQLFDRRGSRHDAVLSAEC
jgi:hypothetical protein